MAKSAEMLAGNAAPERNAYAWLWPIEGLVMLGSGDLYSKISNSQTNWVGRLAGPHIPRLVCRQGPPDFESGLAT